jgi:hypothetical protein
MAGVGCFCRGTMILTPAGEVPVEQLKVGDAVTTLSGAARPATWIGSGRTLATAANERSRPVIVRRDAIAEGVPSRDLYVTGCHSLYLDGVLIPAEFLVNGHSVVWDEATRVVEYYHIELQTHDVLVADGAPAESYKEEGNRDLFLNNDGRVVSAEETEWFAPVHTCGPVAETVWRRLLQRSGFECPPLIGFEPPPLTSDPDLHLVADGERVDAEVVENGAYRFCLEKGPVELRIVSRSARPIDIGRSNDLRRLGVAILSIELRGASGTMTLSPDSSELSQGFHGAEVWGGRWTDGDALLLSPAFDGPFELVLTVGGEMEYPLAEAGDTGLRDAA